MTRLNIGRGLIVVTPTLMGFVVYSALGFAWTILLTLPIGVAIAVLVITGGQGSRYVRD